MSEVIVAFWTGTGNTAEMAEYVAEGIKEGGADRKSTRLNSSHSV